MVRFYFLGTGSSRTLSALTLDREVDDSHDFDVTVMLAGTTIGVKQVYVTVEDVNDNPPRFVNPATELIMEVPEDVENGTLVFSEGFEVIDDDTGENSEYILSIYDGNIGKVWWIDPKNGYIYVNNFLDFETTVSYDLKIRATDIGNLYSEIPFKIRIMDINDRPAVFDRDTYFVNITEGMYAADTIVPGIQVNATDPDDGPAGDQIYGLVNDSTPFDILPDGTLTVNSEVDRELNPQYVLVAEAFDKSDRPTTSYVTILVNVLDLNDEMPQFIILETLVYTERDLPLGTVITQVIAEDRDLGAGGEVEYSLLVTSDFFDIDSQSGEVYVKKSLLSISGVTTIDISVSDKGLVPRTNTATISIHVIEGKFIRYFGDFPVNSLGRLSPITYAHEFSYPFTTDIGSSLTVSSQMFVVPLEDDIDQPSPQPEIAIQSTGDQLKTIQIVPLIEKVYHDLRFLPVLLLGYDNRGIPLVAASELTVMLTPSASLEPYQNVTGSCLTAATTSACLVYLGPLPNVWFEKVTNLADKVSLSPLNSDGSTEEVEVEASTSFDEYDLSPRSGVYIVGPNHPVYAGTVVSIFLYITSDLASSGYSTALGLPSGIELEEIKGGPGFGCGKLHFVHKSVL